MKRKILALALCLALAGMLPGQGRWEKIWWGVLSEDALEMARADGEGTEAEDGVQFVWPLWDWLCRRFRPGPAAVPPAEEQAPAQA